MKSVKKTVEKSVGELLVEVVKVLKDIHKTLIKDEPTRTKPTRTKPKKRDSIL